MRWYSESIATRLDRILTWHEWFAWHPVRVGDSMVWLEYVERKRQALCPSYWEYRDVVHE